VTTPVALTVATAVLVLLQVPPEEPVLVSVVVEVVSMHTDATQPVILAVGGANTVTGNVVLLVPQELVRL
jgi:hypothetical protein